MDNVINSGNNSYKQLRGDNPTDPDVFREMFGPVEAPTVPEVKPTHTRTLL